MKRFWMIPLLSAVAAGLAAYGVTRHGLCCQAAPTPDPLQDVSLLTQKLTLSDTQAAEVKRLHVVWGAHINECCQCHCAARARIMQALASGTNNAAQVDAIISEMGHAYEQSERATLEHLQQVRAILNPDQRARFDEMISSCLCRTCTQSCCTTPPGEKQKP